MSSFGRQDRHRPAESRLAWEQQVQEMESYQNNIHSKRNLIPFQLGDNSTDVIINGAHYNLTTLERFEFATYDNGTMSNSSYCYVTLPQFANNMPTIYPNGSIVNGTTCYFPYYPIAQRGMIGLAFAALFALSIMFTLVCLRKHGQIFLQQTKRFRVIGRRWQWYWALFIAACGMISCFSSVDVDRYFLPAAPIVINTFFWYLSVPGVLACVWESVRHWGSWQERQVFDVDPFRYRNHDFRSKVEFYLPLVFYLFAWLNFFMSIPRNWLGFQQQADQAQIMNDFIPTTHDVRFKAAAVLAFCAWLIIPIHLCHTLYHYKRDDRPGFFGGLRTVPVHFWLTLPLVLVIIGYAEAAAWVSSINLGGIRVQPGWMYGLGYAPQLLILYLNIASGLRNPNEDIELIRQRVKRGQETDAMLGLTRRARKPRWWSGVANDMGLDNDAKLRSLIDSNVGYQAPRELRGPRPEQREQELQLHSLARQHLDDETAPSGLSERPFRDSPRADVPRQAGLLDVSTPPLRSTIHRDNSYAPSFSSEATAVSQARPQQIRSMLDV